MVSIPQSRACWGLSNFISLPAYRKLPPSAWWTPGMILISVESPAPLSPARAKASPGRSVRETSFSAWTPPNRFDTFSVSSSGEEAVTLSIRAIPSDLFLNLIDQNGNDNHDPDSHELPKGLDVHKDKSVLNHRNDQCADNSPDDGAGTTEEAGPPDDHGRNAVQQNRFACLSRAGGKFGGIKNPGASRSQRRKNVQGDGIIPNIDDSAQSG